ncbi:hypothetical protein ACXYMU_14360 [Pontibacter sp. CAU 1760]
MYNLTQRIYTPINMLPLRNSFSRYKYTFGVRLLLLLLLLNIVTTACSADLGREEDSDIAEERRAAPTDTAAAPRRAATTISLLGNPFISTQINSLSSYYDRINADFTVDADAIENRHKPNITDTIFTIRFGSSMMEFYAPSQSGELLLQVADIRSSDIALRNNLHVGMSEQELLSRLKGRSREMVITQSSEKVIASNREGAPASLQFHLKNGKVNRIRYEGYVD